MNGIYYPSNCNNVPPHYCGCETEELGRIRSVAFISLDFQFANGDPSNPNEWARGVDSELIFIIPETHGELPMPSPKMGPGFGQTVEQLLGYDFALKYYDPNFASNCGFYNALKVNRNFLVAYCTSSQCYINDVTCTIIPGAPIQDDLMSLVTWEVSVKWQSPNIPCPFDIPDGVFDQCFVPNS